MKFMTQMTKKKEKTSLKFLGKRNLYVSKLREENKGNNKQINKIAQGFEKIIALTKLKELRRYAKNILPN